MKINKWVDFGQDVEIEFDSKDVLLALNEAFATVLSDRSGEEEPDRADVSRALNSIATFFNGLSDEHIYMLSPKQRTVCANYLAKQASRFGNSDLPATCQQEKN